MIHTCVYCVLALNAGPGRGDRTNVSWLDFTFFILKWIKTQDFIFNIVHIHVEAQNYYTFHNSTLP